MLETVANVYTVFELGPVLSESGFAKLFVVPTHPEYVLRIQEYTPDVMEEVRLGTRMMEAGLTPLTVAQYLDGSRHAMLTQRYDMDLEHWFTVSTGDAQECSLWTMRVCRLFREMAKIGLFCIDLKPANIVVNVDAGTSLVYAMKLIDFGGGLCWESTQLLGITLPWRAVYATMLLVFSASLKHSQPTIYRGPFKERIGKLLCVPETRSLVIHILGRPLLRRYWSNLFFSVPLVPFLSEFCGGDPSH